MGNGKSNRIDGELRIVIVVGVLCLLILVVAGVGLWFRWENQQSNVRKESAAAPDKPLETGMEPVESKPPVKHGGRYYYAGIPEVVTYPNPLLVLTNIGYVVAYDEKRKNPVWGCYRLFKVDHLEAPPRPKSFKVDSRTISRVTTKDYSGSGYDRGHLGAPNFAIGVCYEAEAQEETFLMSNITPQRPRMNQDIFENMERMEIRDFAQRFEEIWIISGSIFDDKIETLDSGVEIPDACYHVVVDEERGKVRVLAFIIPQTVKGNESLGQFLATLDEVEERAGVDLLSELEDEMENKVEREKAVGVW